MNAHSLSGCVCVRVRARARACACVICFRISQTQFILWDWGSHRWLWKVFIYDAWHCV